MTILYATVGLTSIAMAQSDSRESTSEESLKNDIKDSFAPPTSPNDSTNNGNQIIDRISIEYETDTTTNGRPIRNDNGDIIGQYVYVNDIDNGTSKVIVSINGSEFEASPGGTVILSKDNKHVIIHSASSRSASINYFTITGEHKFDVYKSIAPLLPLPPRPASTEDGMLIFFASDQKSNGMKLMVLNSTGKIENEITMPSFLNKGLNASPRGHYVLISGSNGIDSGKQYVYNNLHDQLFELDNSKIGLKLHVDDDKLFRIDLRKGQWELMNLKDNKLDALANGRCPEANKIYSDGGYRYAHFIQELNEIVISSMNGEHPGTINIIGLNLSTGKSWTQSKDLPPGCEFFIIQSSIVVKNEIRCYNGRQVLKIRILP